MSRDMKKWREYTMEILVGKKVLGRESARAKALGQGPAKLIQITAGRPERSRAGQWEHKRS